MVWWQCFLNPPTPPSHNPHIIFILKCGWCENDNAFEPRVSMATAICILKNDAVEREAGNGEEVVRRIAPISAERYPG